MIHDLHFPLQFNGLGQLKTVQGDSAWRQQIRTVLLTCCQWQREGQTTGGERLLRPSMGCRLQHLLHEPVSEETAALSESLLLEDLNHSLPHVPLVDIQTRIVDEEGRQPALQFHLQFASLTGQALEPLQLQLSQQRVEILK